MQSPGPLGAASGSDDEANLQGEVLQAIGDSVPAIIYRRVKENGLWKYWFVGDRVPEFFDSASAEVFRTEGGFDASFLHPEDRERVLRSYRRATAAGDGVWSSDFRIVSQSGTVRWLRAFARIESIAGRELSSVTVMLDISQEYIATQRLREAKDRDLLTGLFSRTHFELAVGEAAHKAKIAASTFAVIVFDIDDFHEVNEAYGFDAGDRLLRAVAQLATGLARGAGVGRLSADTFGILAEVANHDGAVLLANELIAAFERPIQIEGHLLWITASAGVVVSEPRYREPLELLRAADSALARAREAGGGAFRIYSEDTNLESVKRFTLKERLREALVKDQFRLHYQPKVDITNGRIIGCEALIRWNHPELGFQAPAKFIPVAERSGLIIPIGEWVMHEACRQYVAWRDAGVEVVPIAVNVSAIQFLRADMLLSIERALAETGAAPEGLEIEITESMLVDCSDQLLQQMHDIRALGVGIALDDFGTGFSSLAYLKRLPLSHLKIDQTFVRGALWNKSDAAIVRSVSHLAKQLDLRIVAEGVETAEQLAFVSDAGCNEAQGYFFSPPLMPADLTWFLENKEMLAGSKVRGIVSAVRPQLQRRALDSA